MCMYAHTCGCGCLCVRGARECLCTSKCVKPYCYNWSLSLTRLNLSIMISLSHCLRPPSPSARPISHNPCLLPSHYNPLPPSPSSSSSCYLLLIILLPLPLLPLPIPLLLLLLLLPSSSSSSSSSFSSPSPSLSSSSSYSSSSLPSSIFCPARPFEHSPLHDPPEFYLSIYSSFSLVWQHLKTVFC